MEPFTTLTGPAAAIPGTNIDTDVIMPKVFLKGIDRAGLARGLFHDLRFDGNEAVRSDFVLNQAGWTDTRFLIVGPNFGTGSSREHAVWGLLQFGIRAIVGTSFAGIFADNARNNGLALISLAEDDVARLRTLAENPDTNTLTINLPGTSITSEANSRSWRFSLPASEIEALTKGLDKIGRTLSDRAAIEAFEVIHRARNPTYFQAP